MSKSNNESSSGTHVDMWQPMSGKKSTIKDKVDKGNLRGQYRLDMWHERTSSLDPILTKLVGRREREWGRTETERGEKEEEESFRERSSHFSLDFSPIGLAVFDGARGKELPRDKSYK